MNVDLGTALRIESERLYLRPAEISDIPAILALYGENAEHLANSGPKRTDDFLTEEFWQKQIETNRDDLVNDRAVRMFVFTTDGALIGFVNFTAILRGPAQFCYLGYGISKDRQGQGLMSEAVQSGIEHMFSVRNLHRIMANHMPDNLRSGQLLKRLGFVEEGFAKNYLFLNGAWRDHVMTCLTNPDWKEPKTRRLRILRRVYIAP